MQETLFDDLAGKLGIDRLAFRKLNALRDGQETVFGQTLHGVGIAACLEVLEGPWTDALERAERANAGAGVSGMGLASRPAGMAAGIRRLPIRRPFGSG